MLADVTIRVARAKLPYVDNPRLSFQRVSANRHSSLIYMSLVLCSYCHARIELCECPECVDGCVDTYID